MRFVSQYNTFCISFKNSYDSERAKKICEEIKLDHMYFPWPDTLWNQCGWVLGFKSKINSNRALKEFKKNNLDDLFIIGELRKWIKM